MDGPGSVWTNSSVLAVASSGTGALNITGGGTVSSFHGRIGREAGSSGTVLIDGPGSRWDASGVFTMGLSGTGTATLTVQNGGVLSAAGGMSIGPLGTVRGDGTIVANVNATGGFIAPGAAGGTSPGTLHVTGNYAQSTFLATLDIELGPDTNFDKLAVTGNMRAGRPARRTAHGRLRAATATSRLTFSTGAAVVAARSSRSFFRRSGEHSPGTRRSSTPPACCRSPDPRRHR